MARPSLRLCRTRLLLTCLTSLEMVEGGCRSLPSVGAFEALLDVVAMLPVLSSLAVEGDAIEGADRLQLSSFVRKRRPYWGLHYMVRKMLRRDRQ